MMVLSGLILAVALTLASTTIFNLSSTQRLSNASIAEDLADAALQEAIARLSQDGTYGEGTPPAPIVVSDADLPAGAEGRVTFSSTGGAAYSTNNRSGDSDVGWSGRPVPEHKVHLIGTGRCQGVVRRVEMMLHIPKFPLVMGCEGGIVAEDCLIGSMSRPDQVTIEADGSLSYDEDQLERGDLVSNGQVTLNNSTRVTGSVRAAAGLTLLGGSSVNGEILAPFDRADLPQVDITKYDPATDPDVLYNDLPATSVAGDQLLGGVTRYSGNLGVSGQLQLDNAIVYVDGNLNVPGGIHGVGAVFVTGQADLGGGNRLSGLDNVTLMANGNVNIQGILNQASVFQGLVYTHGRLEAQHMNLIGSFVSDSNQTTAFELTDCRMFHTGLTSTPTVTRSVDAVVARFNNGARNYAYKAIFYLNDKGYLVGKPYGNPLPPPPPPAPPLPAPLPPPPALLPPPPPPPGPPYVSHQTVREVLTQANCSNWEVTDPCVLHFEYSVLQSRWLASFSMWGRLAGSNDPAPAPLILGPMPFDQFLVAMKNLINSDTESDFLNSGTAVPDDQLEALLNEVMARVNNLAQQPALVFQIGANELLEDENDKFRVLYRRSL